MQEARLADAHAGRDVVERRAVEPLLREAAPRLQEDRVAGREGRVRRGHGPEGTGMGLLVGWAGNDRARSRAASHQRHPRVWRWMPPTPPARVTRARRWRWPPSPTCSGPASCSTTPSDPHWPDRDRFVLSAGHASILLYSMLHLTGYDLSLDDLRAFRQWGSKTPGHPERGHTDGVEVTTGPLGQGIGNAVGMAIAERQLRGPVRRRRRRPPHVLRRGRRRPVRGPVSHEAASLAGHLGLGRLVCVYDDNHVSIDGPTELALSDDAAARFRAYGWHVERPRRGRRGPRRHRGRPAAGRRRGGPPVAA